MDQDLNKLIAENESKSLFSNNRKTTNSIDGLRFASTDRVSSHFNTNDSFTGINSEETFTTSDTLKKYISVSNENYKYRIHIGTQPGYYSDGRITFKESQMLHSEIIDILEGFLSACNVSYKFIEKDTFYNSSWGLESYACLLLSCSNEIAKGLAALIGLALKQDAVGIYFNDGNESFHSVFTISKLDDSIITKDDALKLMREISEHYKCLSGQFDAYGQNLEFHDFQNSLDKSISIECIKTIINRYFGTDNLFHITKSNDQSDQLKKDDYESAINKAGFQSFSKLVELIQRQGDLYDKPKSWSIYCQIYNLKKCLNIFSGHLIEHLANSFL